MAVKVFPFQLNHPADDAGLLDVLKKPEVISARQLFLLAKIPGPAVLNDSARELAQLIFQRAVERTGGTQMLARIRMILSVGCEGISGSSGWLLADDGADANDDKPRLCLGVGESGVIPETARGTPLHVMEIAQAARAAMQVAGLTPETARLFIVKSPVRRDQAAATGRARGAGALGVAVALGEVTEDQLSPSGIHDSTLHCSRAMVMSGTETDYAEVLVLGNRPGAGGNLVIDSHFLRDLLDVAGIRRLLRGLGMSFDADGVVAQNEGLKLVMLKAGIHPDGTLRGRIMHIHGTDMPADKHLRAAASGVLAGILGPMASFVTGGAEHQAPLGGSLVAAIAQVTE